MATQPEVILQVLSVDVQHKECYGEAHSRQIYLESTFLRRQYAVPDMKKTENTQQVTYVAITQQAIHNLNYHLHYRHPCQRTYARK